MHNYLNFYANLPLCVQSVRADFGCERTDNVAAEREHTHTHRQFELYIDVSGCKEHRFKLVSAVRDAKVHQRSQSDLSLIYAILSIALITKLIHFVLRHYHCDGTLVRLVSNLYRGLRGPVLTSSRCSSDFHYGVGVFQGDPFSGYI